MNESEWVSESVCASLRFCFVHRAWCICCKWLLKLQFSTCFAFRASFVQIYWIVQFSSQRIPFAAIKQQKCLFACEIRWIFHCNLQLHLHGIIISVHAFHFLSNQCALSSVQYLFFLDADMLRCAPNPYFIIVIMI